MSSAGDNGRGGTPPQDVFPHDVRRASVAAVGRACLGVAVLVTAYAVLPLDRLADVSPLISLPLALVGFAAVLAVQVLAIARSTLPGCVRSRRWPHR